MVLTVCCSGDVGDKVMSTLSAGPKDSGYFAVTHFSPLLLLRLAEVNCIVGHLAAYMLK